MPIALQLRPVEGIDTRPSHSKPLASVTEYSITFPPNKPVNNKLFSIWVLTERPLINIS